MSEERSKLGVAVRSARAKRGLTQSALAQRVGISTRAVGEIERGTSAPRPTTATRLEAALGWRRGAVEAVLSGHVAPGSPRLAQDVGVERDLQRLVLDRMVELDVGYSDLARRTGEAVPADVLADIARGQFTGPYDETTMRGLAAALELTPEAVHRAALGQVVELLVGRMDLPPAEQLDVVEEIRAAVDSRLAPGPDQDLLENRASAP